MSVFVIAECCSSWRFGSDHLANAFRMIEAAKECGADAAKFQWTSDPVLMAQRRHGKREEFDILAYPFDWLEKLKAKCDKVGIEFMCTVFIEKDIATIAPLVSRFKVASAESGDEEFVEEHFQYGKEIIASYGFGLLNTDYVTNSPLIKNIHCVVSYPTPIEQLNLKRLRLFKGLSDHSTSVLSGAVAVGVGASILEKHIRLEETPPENPDWPHSLVVDQKHRQDESFYAYVRNIREAEKMMGSGEDKPMECEKVNMGRRVTP